MEGAAIGVTPLLLLPGIGLLLVSTSARYQQVHEEIHALLGEDAAQAVACVGHLLRRGALFRDAMVALYAGAALLAASSLIGAVTSEFTTYSVTAIKALSLLGVASTLLAGRTTFLYSTTRSHRRS